MRPNTARLTTIAFFLALVAFIAFLALAEDSSQVAAEPVSPLSVTKTTMTSGESIGITARFSEDDLSVGTDVGITVSVSPSAGALLTLLACELETSPNVFGASCSTADEDPAADSFRLGSTTVEGLDGDTNVEDFRLLLSFTATCDSSTQFVLTSFQEGNDGPDDGDSLSSAVITCSPATPTPSPTPIPYTIVIEADPNIVPCGGGESTIRARAVGPGGVTLSDIRFDFSVTFGTAGLPAPGEGGKLVQTSNTRATLTLFPGARIATVTARGLTPEGTIGTGSVSVRQSCLDPDLPPGVAVVVTADPNVVACGGQSLITATLRDRTGHIIEGVGFHFATNTGVLVAGPPNTADSIQNSAILRLLPGMPESTVVASVGTSLGTIEGTVTVQQYCPAAATSPGAVALKASNTTVGCGGSAFIAATVRDVSGNVVPDGTVIKFLATAGEVEPDNEITSGGVLNVVYHAPSNAAGNVTISAAGGASFGKIDLTVDCATASQQLGTGGVLPAIRPPNTGVGSGGARITPPNTGDGGMADGGAFELALPAALLGLIALGVLAVTLRRPAGD